jgi:oligopeptide transport system substrate-binding protein
VALSGCGSSGSTSETGTGAKALTIALGGDEIPYINPLNDNGTPGIRVAQALFSPLVRTNPETGKVENVIADSVEPNDDSTKWTIKIKDGLTFDNGQPLTSQDYVDSWNMTSQLERGWKNAAFFSKIKGWDAMNPLLEEGDEVPADLPEKLSGLKVVDDTTFTVELSEPFSQFGLTLQYLGAAPMAEEARKDPEAFNRKPIGMGPYKLKDAEWTTGTDLVLQKSSSYKGPFAPEADEVTFRFIANGETAYNDFLAGNLDFVQVPSSKIGSYEQDAPGQSIISQNAGAIFYLVFPMWDEKFADADLRKAFSMAINRDTYAKLVGIADPATSYVQSGLDGYRADSCGTSCAYDPAAAKALLQKAGGLDAPLKLYYSTDSSTGQVYAEALGNMFRQGLGIEVKYVGKTGSEIGDLADKKKLDGLRISGWGYDYPSIENDLTPVFACQGDANFAGYCNSDLDQLIKEGNKQSDPAKAVVSYQAAEDAALADMPLIPLYMSKDVNLHSAKIKPQESKYTGVSPLYSTFTS